MLPPFRHRTRKRFRLTPASTLVVGDVYCPLSTTFFPGNQYLADFWSVVRSDGGDVRVYMADGVTPLACEVAGFDYATGVGALYFPVSGCASFVVEAGSGLATPAADSTYGKYNVWGSSAKIIAHMADMSNAASASYQGSSPTPPTFVAGKIGYCGSFAAASTNYINFGTLTGVSARTIDLWFKVDSYTGYPMMLTCAGFEIAASQGGNRKPYFFKTGYAVTSWPDVISSLNWCKFTATIDSVAGLVLYRDGQPTASNPDIKSISLSSGDLLCGKRADGNYYSGKIDEVRIWDTALSADGVAQKYANQNDPATFWTLGAE